MRHYYINKEWMLSTTARHIYRAASILSLMLVPSLFWLIFLQAESGMSSMWLPVARWLALASILGTATTIVAMEYFIFGFDDSSTWKKTFWAIVVFIPTIGAPIYCLIVYSNSDVLKLYQQKREKELAKRNLTSDFPQSNLLS